MRFGGNTPCPICGKVLELDDIDTHSKGNQDEIWICDDCCVARFVGVRNYNIVFSCYYCDGIKMSFVDIKNKKS